MKVRVENIRSALDYAASDRSDPFAFNRAMTHASNRVGYYEDSNGRMAYAYEAERYDETRKLPDGREFKVDAYKNVARA